MIRDLRTILEGWDFEPGKISVRKVIGRDGRERSKPGSIWAFCNWNVWAARTGPAHMAFPRSWTTTSSGCAGISRLRATTPTSFSRPRIAALCDFEAYLYYQRDLSLFVLEEFEGVERDTARNLRVMELWRATGRPSRTGRSCSTSAATC